MENASILQELDLEQIKNHQLLEICIHILDNLELKLNTNITKYEKWALTHERVPEYLFTYHRTTFGGQIQSYSFLLA